MINIIVDFIDAEKFKNFIRYIDNIPFVRAEAEAGRIADETVEEMKDTITSARKNPDRGTHKLENALDWDEVKNIPGQELILGIGNINKLKEEAPYFEMIDSGFTYTTRQTHVVPTTYFADKGTGFITFKAGSTHTIEGIQYIDKALLKLDKKLTEVVLTLGGEIIDGMSKS